MLRMVSYPHRPQSGHITCYLNRTYHVLPTRIHNPFDRACRAVLLSPALFGLVEGLRLSIGPFNRSNGHTRGPTACTTTLAWHWAQGSRGTQLPIEPGQHLSRARAGSWAHPAVMVVTAFWC